MAPWILHEMARRGLDHYDLTARDLGRVMDNLLGHVRPVDVGRRLLLRRGLLYLECPLRRLEREAGRRVAW